MMLGSKFQRWRENCLGCQEHRGFYAGFERFNRGTKAEDFLNLFLPYAKMMIIA